MQSKHVKESDKRKIILSFCSVLLVLVFAIISAFAWFFMSDTGVKSFNFGFGKVKYEINQSDKLFYDLFDTEGNDYVEDDFDPEEGYVNINSVASVLIGGESITANDNGDYEYDLMQYSKARITFEYSPANSTPIVTYSSLNPEEVKVSDYGTIKAIGHVGDTVDITADIYDRNPLDGTKGNMFTSVTFKIRIIANPDQNTDEYGFLPGNQNILKMPLSITNYSTVKSKVRLKIQWEYNDFSEDDTQTNTLKKYNVEDLFENKNISNIQYIKVESNLIVPVSLQLGVDFQNVPATNDSISFMDINSFEWTVNSISLTDAQLVQVQSIINGTSTEIFYLTEKMIDKASIYITYSKLAVTDSADYGDAIPSITSTQQVPYIPLNGIITSDTYASFSTRKVINFDISLQARQAEYYDSSENWFDVFTANDTHDTCN